MWGEGVVEWGYMDKTTAQMKEEFLNACEIKGKHGEWMLEHLLERVIADTKKQSSDHLVE